MGEFFYAVNQAARGRGMDPRLNYVEFEQREQSFGVGAEGGFAIPNQFRPELMQVGIQNAIVRPRARVIPAGSPPDSSVTMPALNQTSSPYGGVTVSWIDEGETKPETSFTLKEITLTPHEVAAHTIVTDKLLRNWAAADSVLTSLFRAAMVGAEDYAFLRGTGVGQPLGVINAPATKTVARGTASTIVYADLRGMINELIDNNDGAQPVFIASPKTKTQLMAIVDPGTAGTLIWQFDARTGMPGTLMGYPLVFNARSPGLGNTGDLMLVDLSYYLIKDGSGPFVDASPHVYFTTNKTVFKCFWNVDGQPWLDAPMALEGDTTHTVSPFVVLA